MYVVRESTDMELTNCVRNFESARDGMIESMNAYKSQRKQFQVRNES
jgi:hypothetical protein